MLKRMALQGLDALALLWGRSQTAHKGSRCGDGCVDEDGGLCRRRRQRDVVKPLRQRISGFYCWC
jgi:hypothetical protein